MRSRAGYVDQALADEYVNFLIGKKQFEAASQAWGEYSGGAGGPERVFNGDFETDPIPQATFDWHVDRVPGVEVSFDKDAAHSGARSLKLQFDRPQNLTSFGVAQSVYLKPGSYRSRAWVKTPR